MKGDEHIKEQEEEFQRRCEWCDREFLYINNCQRFCCERCFKNAKADDDGYL